MPLRHKIFLCVESAFVQYSTEEMHKEKGKEEARVILKSQCATSVLMAEPYTSNLRARTPPAQSQVRNTSQVMSCSTMTRQPSRAPS